MWTQVRFQFRNEIFFTRSRKIRGWAEAYIEYAAQPAPQFDAACPAVALAKAEDCEKGPFLDGNQLIFQTIYQFTINHFRLYTIFRNDLRDEILVDFYDRSGISRYSPLVKT